MSDLLIAVGGTGQHVALATSRLIRLRALPPMQAMIIDADSQGQLSQEMRTFGRTLKVDGVAEPMPHPMIGGDEIMFRIMGENVRPLPCNFYTVS